MDLTPGPEVYLAAALAQQAAWRPDEDPDFQRRIAERMAAEPPFRVAVEAAYRAGQKEAARVIDWRLMEYETEADEAYARRKAMGIEDQAKELAIRSRTWKAAREAAASAQRSLSTGTEGEHERPAT